MKTQTLFAATLALSLAACGQSSDKGAETATPAKAIPAATDATPATADDAITKEFMIGKWAEETDGDCKLAQNFNADGSVEGFFESWKIEGSNLVVKVMGETQTMSVKVIDPKHIDAKLGGNTKRLIRC